MKVYAVLTIRHDDDYKNCSDSYNLRMFNSAEERLKWLCYRWFDNIEDHIREQYADDDELEELKKDELLEVKLDDSGSIKSIEMKQYSYENLNKLIEKYCKGYYVDYKFSYELYEENIGGKTKK